ncbi:MAG: ribonuclease III [Deltaproteobacteria bacterium]|nr:ribonuclease III [Deltaproteobacteria bacterium]
MTLQSLELLETALGHLFRDKALLQQAMHHSSFVNEQHNPLLNDNERLEFLGDAVLDLVVSHILMDHFPNSREGDLSRMRAAIVNETQLASIAQRLRIGDYIRLGKGETLSHGEQKASILADAFEAVMAAVYLDGGLAAAFGVVRRHFSEIIASINEKIAAEDFKSQLQELVQARYKTIPCYRVIKESGPDHDKTFEVRLTVADRLTAWGTGKSKKAAEQDAASEALRKLQENSEDHP